MDLTYDRMSGAVGSLMLVWARIERSVRDDIARHSGSLPSRAHGITALLDAWERTVTANPPDNSLCLLLVMTLRDQLRRPIDIRNGVCHGLDGISLAIDNHPPMLRWTLNGEEGSITWDDLQAMLFWLSKIAHAFSNISDPSIDRPGNRAIDNEENRAWWRSEFALNLPDE